MRHIRSSALFVPLLVAASTSVALAQRPLTRAERSNYTETSTHADVVAFVDSLKTLGAPVTVSQLATTTNGRRLPLVIASRPQVSTPAEARRLNRPIVYVQGNIHGGEVEGKEALQALLRDWSFNRQPNVLDSLVLVIVPIYNADGNDSLGPQMRNRGSQNGPAMIGLRPNGMGLDLNRDYIKAEAPETRGSLAAFNTWNPDVVIDLHTTNGSYHGYVLTYSPSLHPASPLTPYVRDTLLTEVQRRMRTRHQFEIFPYGNFTGRTPLTNTQKDAWVTYDHRQRFGTNYYGLRGRISILSEAYSHDPFERRVASTRAFVQEVLSLLSERAQEVRARVATGTEATTFANARRVNVPIAARFDTKPDTQPVLVEVIERVADSSAITEAGMVRGHRRTGRSVPVRMPVVDRFEAAITQTPPHGYVLIQASDSTLATLRQHGLTVTRIEQPVRAAVEAFTIDSVRQAARPFQGHREATVTGRWTAATRELPAGSNVVTLGTPLDLLTMQLLEPQSDDGLLTWNHFDAWLAAGKEAPVLRLAAPLRLTSTGR